MVRNWKCLLAISLLVATASEAQAVYTGFQDPEPVGVVGRESSEFEPIVSPDGRELYFVSCRFANNDCTTDIWRAMRDSDDSTWGEPAPLDALNYPASREDGMSISQDGRVMIFGSNRGRSQDDYDLYQATRAGVNEPWQTPVNLGSPVNTSGAEFSASLSGDGLSLYISGTDYGVNHKGPNPTGGSDIWISTRETIDAPWSDPVNVNTILGPVNSRQNETNPSISPDGLELYFSSDRRLSGMTGGNGWNLWVATRDTTKDRFREPIPLNINTNEVDFSPFVAADGTLYFNYAASFCCNDRWTLRTAKPLPLSGDFDVDRQLDVADIEFLSAHLRSGGNDRTYDLNQDGAVDQADRRVWVTDLKRTYYGDADFDRDFDSSDLVAVFAVGEYEDLLAANSTWSEGDWSGDGDFMSNDLVLAFQDGGYENGMRSSVNTVPEPTVGMWIGALVYLLRRTPRSNHEYCLSIPSSWHLKSPHSRRVCKPRSNELPSACS